LTILVTGGAGFIGSHLVDALSAAGRDVCVIDDFRTGRKEHVSSPARIYEADIRSCETDRVFAAVKPEIVVHLAAQTSVPASLADPLHDADVNVAGLLRILHHSVNHGVRKIVFASSAAVYSNTSSEGAMDETTPLQPVSFYGMSKWTGERYLELYARHYGLSYSALRFANVYGPRQSRDGEAGVVPLFISNLLQGNRPVVYGDGSQTRDFVYVKDVAEAIIAALHHGDNQTVNVSSGEATSVNRLLAMTCECLGIRCEPQFANTRPGDIGHSHLSNRKAKAILEWSPRRTLIEGLAETCDYYRSMIS